jgi:hypothetical protein
MDAKADSTAHTYRREQAQRGRFALAISFLALIVSAWTLYETALRQPAFTAYASAGWSYGRGASTDDESLTVPLTIANHGARPGAVLAIVLTLAKPDGGERRLISTGILLDDTGRTLFTPISIQGRSAFSAPVVFTSDPVTARGPAAKAVIDGAGSYRARITLCTTYPRDFGVFDRLLTPVTDDLIANLTVADFNIAQLLAGRSAAVTAEISPAAPAPVLREASCSSG